MVCEFCWKKSDHADFIEGGWSNVCKWCCRGGHE
jgi:hypothetical protein